MRGQQKKPFIRSIGDAGNLRRSSLAKQAISAICGDTAVKEYAPPKTESETAVCDCCERTDVIMEQLVKIDSGQLLCGDCLAELRQSG